MVELANIQLLLAGWLAWPGSVVVGGRVSVAVFFITTLARTAGAMQMQGGCLSSRNFRTFHTVH